MSSRPCHWHEEPDGIRHLIPGCAALAEHRIADLHQQLDDVRRRHHRFQRWHDCVMDALRAHPDGAATYRTAQMEFRR
ncbi:hypothetical protein [Streptomyces mobaraensis]|uniref:Uncharacterized protein n=1 Tax=Streptomyces mobaraensis TaxID=35621 RepID=A0A5N5W419_STRMB|nr:hypothetical protein [Streptomyces mobaraensis]KAB7839475.1 hypothetical protein FRZ00_21270 [Streptomyces mobaraensis]